MRLPARAVGLLALALAAITCTDAPTGPGSGPAGGVSSRIGLAPSFSADAVRAYRSLDALGFDVTNVRLRLITLDGKTAKDTAFAFPTTLDTLRMDLSLQITGSEQTFTALLELRDESNTVFFKGSRLVTARAGGLPNGAPPTIALEYAGPGREARSIAVSPADSIASTASGAKLTATALDSAGRAVPDLLVRWSTIDVALATVEATGSASAELRATGKRGVATIVATTPTGLSAQARISLVPPASRLVVSGGGAQSGIAGRVLAQPLVVELQAADGGPVPNSAIAFRALTVGGSVATSTATTDAAGRAQTPMTLGKTAGSYAYEASAGSLATVDVSATATPAPATSLSILSGNSQSDSAGRTLDAPLVVQVSDEFGGGAAGASVAWRVISGSGSPVAASSVSNAEGLASMRYTLGRVSGSDSVRATLAITAGGEASVVFTTVARPRGPTVVEFLDGTEQRGTAGAALANPLVVVVRDQFGNAVPGAGVRWSATVAGARFSPASSTTDATGRAQTTMTLPPTPGPVSVVATLGSLTTTTTATATAVAGAPSTFVLQSVPSVITVGGPPLTNLRVQIADDVGNAIARSGVEITATAVIAPGMRTVTTSASTNASGVATFNIPSYIGPRGSAAFTFTSPGFAPLVTPTISFAPGPAAVLAVATQPARSAASGIPFSVQPSVTITDAGANSVAGPGASVTAYIASGGGVLGGATNVMTDTDGVARFTGMSITGSPGLRTLGFSSGALEDVRSNQIALTATPSALDSVSGFQAPQSSSGSLLLGGFRVRLVDASRQNVPLENVPITVRATPFGSTTPNIPLLGRVTRLTDANGVATFDDLAFSTAAGVYTLTARADPAVIALPALTLVDSFTLLAAP